MRTKWKRHVCILLPNKQHLDCAVRVRARGHEVLNSVLKQLGVSDLQVFGLAVLRDNEYLFVDLDQKLSKYFGKRWNTGSIKVPFILFLRVQFYLEAGQLIMSSKEQQLYYSELRQKVLRSQNRHQEALFFQLAASALQAEVGDLEQKDVEGEERKQRHYFLPEDYFPSWLIKRRGRDFLLQNSPVLHGELRGVSHIQAILQFIREASSLQDGAVTFYRMKQEKKELRSSILLAVAVKGLHIYQFSWIADVSWCDFSTQEVEGKQCMRYDFSWIDIDRLTFQGSRFEIAAVGSLCLPKLVYYTHSAFHSKHILRHLSDSHRLHISTRDAVSHIQQLENMKASQLYKEAYICDIISLKQRLHCSNLTSSMSDCSVAVEAATCSNFSVAVEADTDWDEEEEEEDSLSEAELWLDEPEEVFVDDPAEVSWLAELLHGVSVDGPLLPNSSDWAAVTMEMKQILWRRADEGASVD